MIIICQIFLYINESIKNIAQLTNLIKTVLNIHLKIALAIWALNYLLLKNPFVS